MDNPVTLSDVPITQQFGVNPAAYARFGLPGHNGLDLAVPLGTQLFAPEDGTISEIGLDPAGYGTYLKLLASSGREWLLAHLSGTLYSQEGDFVVVSTPIALSGNSGNSTGPHVHVGLRPHPTYRATPYNGWVDPEPDLAYLAGT